MKLSEAIRLGGTLHRQVRGAFHWDANWKLTGTCALMGAALALGAEEPGVDNWYAVTSTPQWRTWLCWPSAPSVACPTVCGCPVRRLNYMVVHLNDRHGWTRDQIADWLAASGYDCECPDLSENAAEEGEEKALAAVGR